MRQDSASHPRSSSRTGLSGLLIALALVSGLCNQVGGVPGPRADAVSGREGERPLAEDADPLEDADPVEDPSEGEPAGEDEPSRVEQAPGSRFLRGPRRRPECPRPLAAFATPSRRSRPRDPVGTPPRASGRALRHWLQSQVC